MTRLRPLVIPAAALVLATAAPSAGAQQRRPVELTNPWVASSLVAEHADEGPLAVVVQPAIPLTHAGLDTSSDATAPDGRLAAPTPPRRVAAAGRPILRTARGPP